MIMQRQIEQKLKDAFAPTYMLVQNESDQHSVPPGSETHFRAVIVSSQFDGLSRVRRQQFVYTILATELKTGVHALGLQTFTPDEWAQSPARVESPDCASKNK